MLALALAALLRLSACDSASAVDVEHAWLANESDPAALDEILAPDFVHTLGSGQFITKAEHIDYIAAHPPSPGRQTRFEQLHVRVVSGVAIATGIVLATDASGVPTRRTVFTDVFACREDRWQAVGAQETVIAPR